MRGGEVRAESMFSYVSSEGRVQRPGCGPGIRSCVFRDHPLQDILPLIDAAASDLSTEFAALYVPIGRPFRLQRRGS